jgi:glucose-1-phosphate cytidylyltransferase
MKVVLLAGGKGTRLAEETGSRPKPMVEIGSRPLLWHLMKYYASFGHREFYAALGYKGAFIKEYFLNYSKLRTPELSVDLRTGEIATAGALPEDWLVHLVDTGVGTMTGGRVARLRSHLHDSTFMLTYGDGLSNIDLDALLEFHRSHGRIATVTAVRPPARFGDMRLEGDRVVDFQEKPASGEGWINGGFFVFEPAVLDYIPGDTTHLEVEPLATLAQEDQLRAFRHDDFWQCMDTLRDLGILETHWKSGKAPWARVGSPRA